jgi:hypothetical protein
VNEYKTKQLHVDEIITYEEIDTALNQQDLVQKWNKRIVEAIALDKEFLIFNGVDDAESTLDVTDDEVAKLDKGIIKQVEEFNPLNYIEEYTLEDGTTPTDNKVRIGSSLNKTAGFKTIDQCIDQYTSLIPRHLRRNIVAMFNNNLLAQFSGKLYEQSIIPSEKDQIQKALHTWGGLPAYIHPDIPDNTIIITSFDNIAMYYRKGSLRRKMTDDIGSHGIRDIWYWEQDICVQDLQRIVVIKNVSFED